MKVMVVGQAASLKEALHSRSGQWDIDARSWTDWQRQSLDLSNPDAYLFNFAQTNRSLSKPVERVKNRKPKARIMLVVGPETDTQSLESVMAYSGVDFVTIESASRELPIRLASLLTRPRVLPNRDNKQTGKRPSGRKASGSMSDRSSWPSGHSSFTHLVPELHDEATGRLDARRVSEQFGVRLAEVADALGSKYTAVHKTPAAVSLQPGLRVLERIAAGLFRLLNGSIGLRIWLHASNPELEGETPWDVIKRGQGVVVESLVEDALLGQPN